MPRPIRTGGRRYNGLGRYEQAVDDLSKAIELDPENAGAFTNRGLALFALGRYDQSVADLTLRSSSRRETPIPYFNRAEVLYRLGERDKAIADYNEAVRLDPRMAAAYAASARMRDEIGQRDRAMRDYDMALKLDPRQVSLYYDRGNVQAGSRRLARRPRRLRPGGGPRPKAGGDLLRAWLVAILGRRRWGRLRRKGLYLVKGWRDPLSPYMAVLAALGSRHAGRPAEGEKVLAEALVNLSPRPWPVPVLRYMKGDLSEASLLQVSGEQAPADRGPRVHRCRQAAAWRPQGGPRPPALGQRERLGGLDRRRRCQGGARSN